MGPHCGRNAQIPPTTMLRRPRRRSMSGEFNNLNLPLEVRNSASGGWHCVYDVEQIDFRALGHISSHSGDGSTSHDNVENAGFTAEELEEIESGVNGYANGDMNDQSDGDLIRAYNEAMAIVEPEVEDVNFAMQSFGSEPNMQEDMPT